MSNSTWRPCAAAVALVVLTLAVAGCAGSTSTTPSASSPAAASSTPAAASNQAPGQENSSAGGQPTFNEPVTVGTWTVTLGSVSAQPMYAGTSPAKGNEFLRIAVSLENNGSEAAKLSSDEFTLTDASGKTYKPMANDANQWIGGMDSVPAGGSVYALGLMFEVPRGSTGLNLVVDPKSGGGPQSIPVR